MRAKTIRKGKIWYNGKVGLSRQTIKKGTASKMKNLHQQLLTDYGIDFSDLNLLQTAFTHTSYANEHRLLKISHNERLEFLGDAVLQLIISKYLYKKYPHFPEGEMSKLRSSFVREESLAGFARSCGFDAHLLLGKGRKNQVAAIEIPSWAMPLRPFWEPCSWTRERLPWRNSSTKL